MDIKLSTDCINLTILEVHYAWSQGQGLPETCSISLEDLVPQDNFYRQVERSIDLSFIHDLADEFYSSIGRPSVDPVVFFKLQLIAFFEGIRSERQLMETVNLNLAHRWFIGYDLDERVPDHSSLSKIRERFGLEVFQQFFERIVELCIEAGLVWGEELYFDSTKVQANASVNRMIDRTEYQAQQHLEQLLNSLKKIHLPSASWWQSTKGKELQVFGSHIINVLPVTGSPLLIRTLPLCSLPVEVVLCWVIVITMLSMGAKPASY